MQQDRGGYVFFNGEIVAHGDAKIHVMSPAFKYGAAVYEGIRAYWNAEKEQLCVFRLDDHSRRLLNSIKAMRMDCRFTAQELSQAVLETLRVNGFREDLHIRQSVFIDGEGGIGATGPVGMSVVPLQKGRFSDLEGIDVCVSSWTRVSDNMMPPRIKCCANYHNGRLAQLQAILDGYDAPLLLDSLGKVAEAPTATFFLVRNGIPITCPLTSSILESITRSTVVQLFEEVHQVRTAERAIDRTELYIADEAFLCGSGFEVVPVLSVDRHVLGDGQPGPLTRAIQKTYFDVVLGAIPEYSEWRTAVY